MVSIKVIRPFKVGDTFALPGTIVKVDALQAADAVFTGRGALVDETDLATIRDAVNTQTKDVLRQLGHRGSPLTDPGWRPVHRH